ncbi:MAG TPA: NADP-dependent oxidoreductase [Gammaproteobacteria bacterium]|nr:NADP-dependent oxidoreductase [Gammaproteobacteria bacterium]
MTSRDTVNRRIVLASRPNGEPVTGNFRLEDTPIPEPGDGQMLLRTLYLSLDPYMRGRMDDAASYAAPVEVGDVMEGATVCEVVASRLEGFQAGDLVVAGSGWQTHALSDGGGVVRLPADMKRPSLALGILGMPGLTAWHGLTRIGRPAEGETVVVSAATGAVGSVVAQLARLRGTRVVGIAGSPEKCRYAVDTLGMDACVNHRDDDLEQALERACPDGIDVYFENVGGRVQRAVLPLLNVGARIPLCGLIAHYNANALPQGPDRTPQLLRTLLVRRATMQGFIILDHWDEMTEFQREVAPLVESGQLHYREDEVSGIERAPEAFLGLLRGENFGKLVVHVGGRGSH